MQHRFPMNIPFNRPVRLPGHLEFLSESLDSGHLSGNGPFSKKCESKLQEFTGSPNLLVSSATHALEMMALLLDVGPGDEVIVPSFTFVSTANAFALRGARIVFADNDEFGQLMPSEVERLCTPRTKAVVAVHYAGNSPDMAVLQELCDRLKVALLEDAAQAIGGSCRGKPLGTFGRLGCFSFHETKNIGSGEGGSLIVNDPQLVSRAEIVREKGTNRRKFLQGLADKYTWVDIGSSYLVSDLNAAYLWPQLEQFESIQLRRREIWSRYAETLAPELSGLDARILGTPSWNSPNWHIFGVLFADKSQRDSYIAAMREVGITAPFHYIPLHASPFGLTFAQNGRPDALPGCEKISACLVRLPLFFNMSDAEVDRVIDCTRKWISRQ